MSAFRPVFESWLQGKAPQDAVEAALADEVTQQPQARAGALALIEAYRRIGRLPDAAAERLRAIADRPELVRPAPPAPPPAPPSPLAGETGDRTVLRPRAPASPPVAPPPPPQPAAPAAVTPAAPPAAAAPPSADRTVLKPRAPAATPPAAPVAPPAAAAPPPPPEPAATTGDAPAAADRTVLKPRAGAAATPAAPAATPPQAPPAPPAPPQPSAAPPAGEAATRLRPMGADPTGATPPTSRTAGTGTSTSGTSAWGNLEVAQEDGVHVTVGFVLNRRYVLESIVSGGDKGGMGVVYRALDRRNEEAQDRNPYVAVKVLNEEFKRHPESIIALHREAKKAMTLAHPNILTVFNFDRDRDQGDTVFMVMELLEGSPLNDLIRAHKDKGVPTDQALKIIRGIARGLAYAHEKGFVHSDVKPSNAFYTNDGQVKLLDFGIARAARISEGDTKKSDGDKTKFDAASLGAFTPPYASPEQIEGEEPDTRDDVYALAVVSYELLTGRHPFERKDAKTARDEGLKPAPIPSIHRSQWRTLQRALSFSRAQRPPNGAAFDEGLTPKRLPMGVIISSAVAGLILIGAVALLLPGFLERQHVRSIAEGLASPTAGVSAAALADLRKSDAGVRNAVTADPRNRNAIVDIAEREARASFDPASQRYDYAAARKVLDGVADLLTDSRRFDELRDGLAREQKLELNKRGEDFDRLLSAKGQGGDKEAASVVSTRQIIAALDPQSSLLHDARVPVRFSEWASAALDAREIARAEALLKTGLSIAPGDPNLSDLADRVKRAQESAQLVARLGELEKQAAPLAEPAATLATFRGSRDALVRLKTAAPTSAALARAVGRLQAVVADEVRAALSAHDAGHAQAVLAEFEGLLPATFIQGQQAAVAKVVGESEARALHATQLRQSIDGLLAKPAPDDTWAKNLKAALRQLGDISPRDQKIADAESRASRYLLGEAASLRKASRFSEAVRLLATARDFGAADADIKTEEAALKAAQSQLSAENQQRENDAKIAAAKQTVINLAGAGGGRLDEAMAKYRELEKQLKAGDPWVTVDAPKALADGYLRLAQAAAQNGQFSVALAQAKKIQSLTTLTDARYAQAVDAYDRYLKLSEQFKSGIADMSAPATVKDLAQRDPKLYAAATPALVAILTERIRAAASGPDGLAAATRLRDSAQLIFPKEKFPDLKAPRPGTPPPATTTPAQPQPAQPSQTTPATAANPPPATGTPPPPTTAAQPAAQTPAAATVSSAATPAAVVARVEPKSCGPELAGKGRMGARAGCFDALNVGGKGPDLVVVTVNGRNLGIMRNEVSNADYARYCASGACSGPAGAPGLPVTTVSVADAGRYAEWLSQQTGARYRLPTDGEWVAAAGTSFDGNGVNCAFGGRGMVVREVGQGSQNEFGMRDVVGNVREWVSAESGGWRARGGAFGDPLDECLKAPVVGHNGAPDGRTGFRLVREIK
jgi:hypothetical protein